MDFSKYKLQKYLTEFQNPNDPKEVRDTTTQNARDAGVSAKEQQTNGKLRQDAKSTQKGTTTIKSLSPSRFTEKIDYNKQLIKEKEIIRAIESQKSDWRSELQEKVIDGMERQKHPYVTVMPTGDENVLQAVEQMYKTGKKKKESVTEELLDESSRGEDAEISRRAQVLRKKIKKSRDSGRRAMESKEKRNKHVKKGEMDKAQKEHEKGKQHEAQARKDRKDVSDDMPVASTYFNTKRNPLRQTDKLDVALQTQKGTEDAVRSASSDTAFVRRKNYGEEYTPIELDEAKKKCKDGYKYDKDKKKCVKKKKKKSSSSKTTIIVGRGFGRPIYGGGMVHHHHHHDNDHGGKPNGGGNGGNGGNGNGGGGDAGVSEMFDLLGDMLFREMTGAEMNAMKGMTDEKSTKEKSAAESERLKKMSRMERMRREYEKTSKQPSPYDKMSKKDLKKVEKSMGYGQGKNTGD